MKYKNIFLAVFLLFTALPLLAFQPQQAKLTFFSRLPLEKIDEFLQYRISEALDPAYALYLIREVMELDPDLKNSADFTKAVIKAITNKFGGGSWPDNRIRLAMDLDTPGARNYIEKEIDTLKEAPTGDVVHEGLLSRLLLLVLTKATDPEYEQFARYLIAKGANPYETDLATQENALLRITKSNNLNLELAELIIRQTTEKDNQKKNVALRRLEQYQKSLRPEHPNYDKIQNFLDNIQRQPEFRVRQHGRIILREEHIPK